MNDAPWHAHIYAGSGRLADAGALRKRFEGALATREIDGLRFVGALADRAVGPHPLPQFELHFTGSARRAVRALIEASGLTALIHPLTDNDLADHTTLAQWIGAPLALDLSVLDPPGVNLGLARFGRSDM